MFKKRINQSVFALIIMLSLFITACSGGSNKEVSQENKKTDTKVVKTANGDVEIPKNPKRVVVDGYLPTLLILGIEPLGATDKDLENVHIKDKVAGIKSIGAITGELSPEAILSLKPDLIITMTGADKEKEKYDKISKIAPTISLPFETYKNVHEELEGLGKILGKEKEAEEWLKDYDKRVEAAREKVKGIVGDKTVSILGAYDKGYYVYGNGGYRGGQAIYENLKLTPPKITQKDLIDADETFKQISFEVIKDYAGDYIFFDESLGGKLDRNNPVWKSVDAVKNDNVFYLDGKYFWPYDPIAVINQTEKVADMIVEKNKAK